MSLLEFFSIHTWCTDDFPTSCPDGRAGTFKRRSVRLQITSLNVQQKKMT